MMRFPGSGIGAVPARAGAWAGAWALVRAMGVALAGERERWALWLPVFLGVGVALYFSLSDEPPLLLGMAGIVGAAGLGLAARRLMSVVALALALCALATGFTVAQWRTELVRAPMLDKRLGPVGVNGRVVLLESFPEGGRITLDRPRISGLGPELTPETVRLRLRGAQPAMAPGDWVRLRGVLTPPPPPVAPGAFDFQRQAFFRGLGAVGFAYGPAEVIARSDGEGMNAIRLGIARVRQRIGERIRNILGGARGAIAQALMTGQRSAIPPPVMTAIRESGLAHLLAISGLHIGLVAGILFVGLRAVLALLPAIALRYPIKKWAAAAALPGALAYAAVTGSTVPTQRAFLMVGLVLLAVLLDRRGLSMRMVAWAAAVILLVRPESLLGASFQMSFAAATALIAGYEALRERRAVADGGPPAWPRRVLLYIGGVALTTLIAGSATAPFAVYHFNQVAAYGLAANLVAVPVTALWIMPWAVVAYLLMPFGLEALALLPMGAGIDVVIGVARAVAQWPGAVNVLPAMPMWGLAAIAGGGLWLAIWRRRWRLWGVAGMAAGLLSLAVVHPPDVLVDGKGGLFAVRGDDGGMLFSSLRKARFSRRMWMRRAGLAEAAQRWPHGGTSAGGRLSCDWLGCLYRGAGGKVVALVQHAAALDEDCWIADVVISAVPVRGRCPAAGAVIDRFDLWREGGHAVWLRGGGVRIESVGGYRGRRPWVVRPKKRAPPR